MNQDVTQLTTVMLNPFIYLQMDEPTLLRMKKASEASLPRKGSTESIAEFSVSVIGLLATPFSRSPVQASAMLYPGRVGPDAPVLIALTGEDFNPNDKYRQGVINFIDNQVNPGTGSISVRAEFRNPKLAGGSFLFVPGMFVRVRLPIGQSQMELLVIDRAITSEQGLKYVYVLDEKDKVMARRVTVGRLQNDGCASSPRGLDKRPSPRRRLAAGAARHDRAVRKREHVAARRRDADRRREDKGKDGQEEVTQSHEMACCTNGGRTFLSGPFRSVGAANGQKCPSHK